MSRLPVFKTSSVDLDPVAGERRSPGSFTYYDASDRRSADEGCFIFTCWNADHTSCGTHSVARSGLAANIAALERQGYTDRTARGERWCWHRRDWVTRDTATEVQP